MNDIQMDTDKRNPSLYLASTTHFYWEIQYTDESSAHRPMLQVIHEVLKNKEDKTNISLVFANVTEVRTDGNEPHP